MCKKGRENDREKAYWGEVGKRREREKGEKEDRVRAFCMKHYHTCHYVASYIVHINVHVH
jgi:hypothetical protein